MESHKQHLSNKTSHSSNRASLNHNPSSSNKRVVFRLNSRVTVIKKIKRRRTRTKRTNTRSEIVV
jgi:hypothetical protein